MCLNISFITTNYNTEGKLYFNIIISINHIVMCIRIYYLYTPINTGTYLITYMWIIVFLRYNI